MAAPGFSIDAISVVPGCEEHSRYAIQTMVNKKNGFIIMLKNIFFPLKPIVTSY